MSQAERATEIFEGHEKETGRCFSRACNYNTEEGCEKPIDKPCPQKWVLSGNVQAGVGEDLQRHWKKGTDD